MQNLLNCYTNSCWVFEKVLDHLESFGSPGKFGITWKVLDHLESFGSPGKRSHQSWQLQGSPCCCNCQLLPGFSNIVRSGQFHRLKGFHCHHKSNTLSPMSKPTFPFFTSSTFNLSSLLSFCFNSAINLSSSKVSNLLLFLILSPPCINRFLHRWVEVESATDSHIGWHSLEELLRKRAMDFFWFSPGKPPPPPPTRSTWGCECAPPSCGTGRNRGCSSTWPAFILTDDSVLIYQSNRKRFG